MPVGLVLLSQTPLLFKHAYWLNTAASLQDGCLLDCGHSISMSADLLSLSIACLLALCFYIFYTCWYGVLLSFVSAGIVSHYQLCLLVWWIIIGHAFWFCTPLSAMPVGVVPHYRSYLLVCTIGHTFWCGASLYVMSSGVVPDCRPCLLAWYLTIGHACWSVLHFNRHFDWYSADGRGMATSLVLLLQGCHYIRHVCWSGATLRYACSYSATLSDMQIHVFVKCSSIMARNLIYYKSARHVYRLGVAPMGL